MSSQNAKAVALEVSESIRKGKRINLGKIIESKGYSKQTANAPQRVTNTKSYKEVIDPVIREMMKRRDEAIQGMLNTMDQAKYRDFADALDKLTKNIQLLSGKETEHAAMTVNVIDYSKDA
jgi:mevalonate kinase